MKKGLFKILAATTAASLLLSMSMSAMAATYFTTTTYGTPVDDVEYVDVISTVYGLTEGEQVAYLVHKDQDGTIADEDIVYIDQKEVGATDAANGYLTFSFKTELTNATITNASDQVVGSTVMFGSTNSGWSDSNYTLNTEEGQGGADAKANVVIDEHTVTYSASNGYVYVDSSATAAYDSSTSAKEEGAEDITTFGGEVTFILVPAPGYTAVGAAVTKAVGGAESESAGTVIAPAGDAYATYATGTITDDTEYTFTFVAVTGDEAAGVTAPTGKANTYTETAGVRELSVYGTATNAKEFGILFSTSQIETEDFANKAVLDAYTETTNTIRKFKALGANSKGQFVITLTDNSTNTETNEDGYNALTADNVYVTVYAVGQDDTISFAEATIPELTTATVTE